ncbi:MAG: RagB/SusD family nutrient uptake outer membrane protein [Bacteroidota bacterium]
MLTRLLLGFGALVALTALAACDGFTDEIDPPIDRIESDPLNAPDQIPFVTAGVRQRFNTAHDQLTVLVSGLSDEYIFDRAVSDATFPTFEEIDQGLILLDNNSVDNQYDLLNEFRFLADDLLRRVSEDVDFTGVDEDQTAEFAENKRDAEYTGFLYGGIARYMLATYYGLTQREGGAPIDGSSLIPAAELYAQAIERLTTALTFAGGDYETRLVNSLIARAHLYNGDLGAARAAAANGLVQGDDPFTSNHAPTSTNFQWAQAGIGRTQYSVAQAYVDLADPRVAVEEIPIAAGFFRQALYTENSSPITFMSWQENNLILAEAALDAGDAAGALTLVNENRTAAGLDGLASLDLAGLIVERQKELFTEGARLVDQRRFNQWHLGPDTWQYLPVTQSERNANPNI